MLRESVAKRVSSLSKGVEPGHGKDDRRGTLQAAKAVRQQDCIMPY